MIAVCGWHDPIDRFSALKKPARGGISRSTPSPESGKMVQTLAHDRPQVDSFLQQMR
jgi:hypothetical protein